MTGVVWVVESDAKWREHARQVLEFLGYDVLAAATPADVTALKWPEGPVAAFVGQCEIGRAHV
jgi:hypothetical protein